MSFLVRKQSEIISRDIRNIISQRYKTVTRAINKEFWNIQSETKNSLYVGSYGRGTAINTSDIDILVELPQEEYNRFDIRESNGQSRLLQAIRNSILTTYPRSDVRADGQVVKIQFSDGMRFEILPAFKNINWLRQWDGTYIYPDSNMGGNWKSTKPKVEQEAMKEKNNSSNGLFYDTCKHIRRVRDNNFSSYHLSGIVIDSFAYEAIEDWHWTNEGETSTSQPATYERKLRDMFNLKASFGLNNFRAPGSCQTVDANSSIECLRKVLNYIVE
jgi:predicted nucleotidyltransferase